MRRHFLPILFLIGFSLFTLRSIFNPGFMYSHDSLWHVERLQNMYSLIPLQFPVRWSPSLDNGYGIPLFNFTYPAPYYLGSLFMISGLGPIKAYDLLLLSFYILGGVGIYFLASKKPWIGISAAVLYLTTPYQFLDIFVRGALGEVVALGLFPFVLLSFKQVAESGKLKWYSPLPFALLLLSHNFYGYLFAALLIFFIIFIYEHKKTLIISLFLSLCLSSFFLIPAFFEKSLLLYSQIDHLDFRNHFVYFSQLIYSKWSYFGSLPGLDPREMSYQLGLGNILILLLAIMLVKKSRQLAIYLFVVFVAIFMMLPISDFFWRYIPLLSSIQFPWRFLGVVTVIFPLIYLETISLLLHKPRYSWIKYLPLLIVAIAIYGARNYARPVKWMTGDEFTSLHYEYVGKTTTAQRSEIVPKWATVERYTAGNLPELKSGELSSYTVKPYEISFQVDSAEQQNLIINRNYYPSWVGKIDGQPLSLTPTQTGEISVPISVGSHTYEISYASTIWAKLGNVISLVSLLLILILVY